MIHNLINSQSYVLLQMHVHRERSNEFHLRFRSLIYLFVRFCAYSRIDIVFRQWFPQSAKNNFQIQSSGIKCCFCCTLNSHQIIIGSLLKLANYTAITYFISIQREEKSKTKTTFVLLLATDFFLLFSFSSSTETTLISCKTTATTVGENNSRQTQLPNHRTTINVHCSTMFVVIKNKNKNIKNCATFLLYDIMHKTNNQFHGRIAGRSQQIVSQKKCR